MVCNVGVCLAPRSIVSTQRFSRCVSPGPRLEEAAHSRNWEHTMMILESFGVDVAWKEYGIAGNFIVCR
jgi:hypothetical protein